MEGAGDDPDHNHNPESTTETYMSPFNVYNISTSEMLALRAASIIASAIAANPEGGSILIDGLDHHDREPVVTTPKSGIAVSFDKTTERMIAETETLGGVFTMFAVADWILATRPLVGARALRDAIERGAGQDSKYKVDLDDANRYLDDGLCIGWWRNSGGAVILDWSCVFPHALIAQAAATAIGARQEAVYVIDTQTVVPVEEKTVKGVGFDIIAKGGVKITAKVKN